MSTDDNCGVIIFKWLVTIMSLVIVLPALFDNETRIAFTLTSCVFIFSKFVDNMEGISKYKTYFQTVFSIIGSIVGAIAIGLCFYYFAAIFNETRIVPSASIEKEVSVEKEVIVETVDEDLYGDIETPTSTIDMQKYPFFRGDSFYILLFITLLFYLFEETIFGGCELCKYLNTKKKLTSRRKRRPRILNI